LSGASYEVILRSIPNGRDLLQQVLDLHLPRAWVKELTQNPKEIHDEMACASASSFRIPTNSGLVAERAQQLVMVEVNEVLDGIRCRASKSMVEATQQRDGPKSQQSWQGTLAAGTSARRPFLPIVADLVGKVRLRSSLAWKLLRPYNSPQCTFNL
jgi:hypothetical protein